MQVIAPRPMQLGLNSPLELPNLAAWYDLSRPASTTSDYIRIDSSNRVSLLADTSGNSAVNGLVLAAGTGNYASRINAPAINLLGDLDVRVRVQVVDWASLGATRCLIGREAAGPSRSWVFEITSAGKLYYGSSANGSTFAQSNTSTNATGFAASSVNWVRVTHDVDDGATQNVVTFYTSQDGATWTLLEAFTNAGVATRYDNSTEISVGAIRAGATDPFSGVIYRAQIYNGIAGTLAFDANFTTAAKLATSFTESSSNAATVTINTSGATGARISGARDLYQGTAASQPVYLAWAGTNYGYVNGLAGNYFSTPNDAPVQITGDIDLRAQVSLASYTGASPQTIIAKMASTVIRSYRLEFSITGNISLAYSPDGTTNVVSTSSVSTGFAANSTNWIRATRSASTGSVTFYTSTDGVSWSQLGTVASTNVENIFNSSAAVEIGTVFGGTTNMANGKILRAQIYSGINGSLVSDFNPAIYTSGTTFTASTGEVWTLNGGSTIVGKTTLYFDGSDDYMKAASSSLSQPETVYYVGRQTSWTSGDFLFDGDTSNSGAVKQTTSTPQINLNAGSSVAGNTGFAIKTMAVLTAIYNGASSALNVNRGTATTGNAGAANMSGFTLASAGTAGSYGNQTTNEVLIYSVAHDTTTQSRVVQYEGRKWGVAGV